MQGGQTQEEIDPKLLTSDDKWILLKLDSAIREMNSAFAEYKFSDATAALYRFSSGANIATEYVEASKAVLRPVELLNSEIVKSEAGSTIQQFNEDNGLYKANTLAVMDFVLSHTVRIVPSVPAAHHGGIMARHGLFWPTCRTIKAARPSCTAPWPKPFDEAISKHFSA